MRTFSKQGLFFGLALVGALFSGSNTVEAAEGAASHYLAGANGDIFLATAPQPGFLAANTFWYQSGNAGRAVLSGKIDLDLEVSTFLNLTALTYTSETPVFGGTYTFGAVLPIGRVGLDLSVSGLPRGTRTRSLDTSNMADLVLIPAQLNWTSGFWSYKLAEIVIAPTGAYDVNKNLNIGLNYWSFDTVAAVTWFDPSKGLEFSIAPGIMVNTENTATNYRTGTEFHVDFTVNQFVSANFAIGIKGYYYNQIVGDSGTGALLGDFKGEAFGIGPGFVWVPEAGGGKVTVLGKWLHDFASENRFDTDTYTLTAAFKF